MSTSGAVSKPFIPNLVAAALCAVVTIAYAGSFGGLVFGGPLEPFVGRAVIAALVSSVVVLPMLAWRSSFFFSLGGPDSNPAAILAFTLAAVTSDILQGSKVVPAELVPTALMSLFLSASGCGLILFVLGRLGWGRYVRYIPHPVVGGFLAGSGYLLVAGAWKMLTAQPLNVFKLGVIAEVHPLAWSSVVLVALALLVLTRMIRHFLVIPLVLVGAMVVFHAVRMAGGMDLAAARQAGLLMAPLQVGDWTHAGNFPYGDVRWDLLMLHAKDFAAMTMVAVITILLNTTSLELATNVEGNADTELKALGLANLLIGFGGGMVAVNSFNRSMLNLKAGANSRWSGRLCALIVLGTVLFAPGLIGLMPKPVLTGLILFLGIGLLMTWAIESRLKMPWSDYLIVVAILGIVAVFGMAPGVILGLVTACVSFVFTLSKTPTIRNSFTLLNRRSNVERPAQQAEILRAQGHALRGFVLQGFLFFGTTSRLLDEARAVLGQTRFVLLDFRLVHGVDGSSTVVLKKLRTLCAEAKITLVFSGMSTSVESVLQLGGVEADNSTLRTFPDIDHALEWCEDQVIAAALPSSELTAALAGVLSAEEVTYLIAHFERVEVASEAPLIKQGDSSDSMFIIEHGRVSVYLRLGDAAVAGGRRLRLRTFTVGTVVGEMGLYTGAPRAADVVADVPTRALKLSGAQVAALEKRMPDLANKLHRFVVRSLAQRLAGANAQLNALS
jgi:SulP family sulfate permease